MLNSSQFRRVKEVFAGKKVVEIAEVPEPSNLRIGNLIWNSHMSQMAGDAARLEEIVLMDRIVLQDGRLMYDIAFRLQNPDGNAFDFAPEWLVDSRLQEILDNPNPIKVEIKSEDKKDNQAKINSESGGGMLMAGGSAILAMLGLAALKKKQAQSKAEQKTQKNEVLIEEEYKNGND